VESCREPGARAESASPIPEYDIVQAGSPGIVSASRAGHPLLSLRDGKVSSELPRPKRHKIAAALLLFLAVADVIRTIGLLVFPGGRDHAGRRIGAAFSIAHCPAKGIGPPFKNNSRAFPGDDTSFSQLGPIYHEPMRSSPGFENLDDNFTSQPGLPVSGVLADRTLPSKAPDETTGRLDSTLLGRTAAVVRHARRHIGDRAVSLRPVACSGPDSRLAPGPGPLTKISISIIPMS